MAVSRWTDPGVTHDDVILERSASGRVSNRIPAKRHKTERLIAMLLVFAGVAALAAESLTLSGLLLAGAVSLYAHSRVIALWADDD